jgi:hypothetical protein
MLFLQTLMVQTEEKMKRLDGEMAEDAESISQLLASVSQAMQGVRR